MKLETIFVETIDPDRKPGKLYVSEKYHTCCHICPCGCGTETFLPFVPGDDSQEHYWGYTKHEDGTVTLSPSIKKRGCHAHYHIERSEIVRFSIDPS